MAVKYNTFFNGSVTYEIYLMLFRYVQGWGGVVLRKWV